MGLPKFLNLQNTILKRMSLTDSKLVNLITNDSTKLEKIMIKNDFPLVAFTKVLLRKCLQDV